MNIPIAKKYRKTLLVLAVALLSRGMFAVWGETLPAIRVQTSQDVRQDEAVPPPIQEKFDESALPSLSDFPDLKELDAPDIEELSVEEPAAGETTPDEIDAPPQAPEADPVEVEQKEAVSEETVAEKAEEVEETVQAESGEAGLPRRVPVETASFNGITPTKTTYDELVKIMGEPKKLTPDGGGPGVDVAEFQPKEFRGVAAHLLDKTVFAIIVELKQAMDARQLAKDLGIDFIQSVFLTEDDGRIIGEVFPEIGVAFAYNPNDKLGNAKDFSENSAEFPTNVVQVIFQSVSPEAFLLRAKTFLKADPARSLWDVTEALKLDPTNKEALALKKELEAKGVTLPKDDVSEPKPESEPFVVPKEEEETTELKLEAPAQTSNADRELERSLQEKSDDSPRAPREVGKEIEVFESDAAARYPFLNEAFAKIERLARSRKIDAAQKALKELQDDHSDNPFVVIRAKALEGDIQMILPKPNVRKALECHSRAIQYLDALLSRGRTPDGKTVSLVPLEMGAMEELRVDCYVSAAADVASGNWANMPAAVEKWLQRGKKHLDTLLAGLYKDQPFQAAALRYRIAVRSLAVGILAGEELNSKPLADELIKASYILLSRVKTRAEYHAVCYETALSLDDAAKVCILRDEQEQARKYLERAIKMMGYVRETSDRPKPKETFLLGQLYYRMGQIHAWNARHASDDTMRKEGHRKAVFWYDKAIPCMIEVIRSRSCPNMLRMAEMAKGMSASYWENGDPKRTRALLKTCIFCLEDYVGTHPAEHSKLVIPCENMVRVLEYIGEEQEAEKYRRKLEQYRDAAKEVPRPKATAPKGVPEKKEKKEKKEKESFFTPLFQRKAAAP
ncbi:MAG: hypothetical protein Q4D98_08660 [Planctomycetia bacterium]|nr:hypothetical protein [Planctomycetia bacterium]